MFCGVDDASKHVWLHRRFGFGGASALEGALSVEVDRLLDPDAHGVPAAADPWDDAAFAGDPRDGGRQLNQLAIDGWLERMRTTPRPLEERMTWVWHDHFATSMAGVPHPWLLVNQVRTIQRHALGSFPELLRAMTVDPAMLLWLDGDTSTGRSPNENYGRELLELFSVGLGNHTEADVSAAAVALTGYRVQLGTWAVSLVSRRHDDTAQTLLGRSGVHDVDTVVDAVCASSACATFVATRTIDRLLGPAAAADAGIVSDVAATFRSSGLEIRPMVATIVDIGLARIGADPIPEAPVPWLVHAERSTGVRLSAPQRIGGLRAAGQVPMVPPDVGGWPAGDVWLAAAPVIARATLAQQIADGDDALALSLCGPEGVMV